MKTFTHEFMKSNRGCYSEEQLMSCSFMQTEGVLLSSIVQSEISLKDKFWFVCKKVLTKEQNQKLAIDVAEIVLPIYEKRYPEDTRMVKDCIEAAKLYITGHISLDELLKKRRAAAAAAYAADAAAYAAAAAIKEQLQNYLINLTESL